MMLKHQRTRPTLRTLRGDANDRLLLIGALALGAALMYLFDPVRGNRRRKLLRDQINSFLNQSDNTIGKTARDLGNRTRGLMAETRAQLTEEMPDDVILIERVRSAIGHVVSHPRVIDVTADQGRVMLSGPILAHEVDHLLATVASVRGVLHIDNQLELHQQVGDVPGL